MRGMVRTIGLGQMPLFGTTEVAMLLQVKVEVRNRYFRQYMTELRRRRLNEP